MPRIVVVRALVATATVAAVLATAGCMNQQKTEQLSQVAKGWCKTIRASQVIPVYPLTEDVQVGDVFVVQRPIEDEAQLYDEQGFLPLGHHLVRLAADGWDKFYDGDVYGVTKDSRQPGLWQAPPREKPLTLASNGSPAPKPGGGNGGGGDAGGGAPAKPIPDHHIGNTNWEAAPHAAFPSYSFSIDRSAGLDLGLPIEGIPVALGLLGADHASATVTLADAYSYGLGTDDLARVVQAWADKHPDVLRRYVPQFQYSAARERYEVQYNFLRVVTRAYLIGRTNVSVLDSSQTGGQVSAGLDRSLKLLGLAEGTNANYKNIIDTLNQPLSGNSGAAAPAKAAGAGGDKAADAGKAAAATASGATTPTFGVKAKFVSVSARGVSMDQAFSRPLVIGYLAFDLPIDRDGRLGGRPIATLARVNSGGFIHSNHEVAEWALSNPDAPAQLQDWLDEGRVANRALTPNQEWLKANGLPYENGSVLCDYLSRRGPGQFVKLFWQNKRLNARVITEVMERPPGLGAEKAQLAAQAQDQRAEAPPAAATLGR